jgi:S1-C subfamily serine protease/regulation of enolase protein 1 (concanavalin A-like superfamily)
MAIFMTCPSCNRPGNLPDSFRGGKVKCPGCGVVTEIPGAGSKPKTSPPLARPAASAAPARPQPAKRSLLDDLDEADDEPMIPPPRSMATRGVPAEKPASNLPLLMGVGGGGALLLAVVVAFFTMQRKTIEGPAVPEPKAEVVEDSSPRTPMVPVSTSPPVAANSTYTAPSTYSSSPTATLSPTEAIRRVKDATVYIKVKDGKSQGSGTGFVIRNDGADSVLIATNRHVISHPAKGSEDDDDSKPAGPTPPEPTITVVFRSGEGKTVEQAIPAVILGKDTTGDTSRDLAILSVKGVRNPPKAIEFQRAGQPTEGTELKIYGFPFGEMLNVAAKGNPAITVNKASVSSLRRDDRGELSLIQIDGSVNPGNSGGPIVDLEGRLIGVTVAKLSVADGVGLAIPAAHLDEILAGRPGRWTIERTSDSAQALELQITVDLADPLGKLKTLNLLVAPSDGKAPEKPTSTDKAMPMPNATTYPLAIAPDRKTATARISVPFTGSPKNVLVQFTYESGDSKKYLSVPAVHTVPAGAGKVLAVGERNEELLAKIKATLKKLGELVDPDKDCKMARDAKGIKITIPGKLHTLSPQIVDKKNKAIKNAPMTLADVSGDFFMHVRVTGDMRPGTDAPLDPKNGRRLPITFQGAGIVLWQDRDNYIRLERTCGTAGGPTLVTRLLVEVCKDGRESGRPYYIPVPEGPMSLMLIRKDGHIRCLFGNDGKKWTILQEIAAEFPDKLQVGLLGVNISKKPFTAQFEDFVLIDDKDKVAEEFGSE